MVSSSRRTSAKRGIFEVFLSIAKITASYVGCNDLSSEVEVKWLQDVNWLIHFQIFSKWSIILKSEMSHQLILDGFSIMCVSHLKFSCVFHLTLAKKNYVNRCFWNLYFVVFQKCLNISLLVMLNCRCKSWVIMT